MDSFPYADWAEALEANGAIYTFADHPRIIYLLTGLGIATFLLSMIHIVRNEDRNLNQAAARLAARDAETGGE